MYKLCFLIVLFCVKLFATDISYETAYEEFTSAYAYFHSQSKSELPQKSGLWWGDCDGNVERFLLQFKGGLTTKGYSEDEQQQIFESINLKVQILNVRSMAIIGDGRRTFDDLYSRFHGILKGGQGCARSSWYYHVYLTVRDEYQDLEERIYDFTYKLEECVSPSDFLADMELSETPYETIPQLVDFTPTKYLLFKEAHRDMSLYHSRILCSEDLGPLEPFALSYRELSQFQ